MPRHLRLQYPDAIYHVLNRGNRRERHMSFSSQNAEFGNSAPAILDRPEVMLEAAFMSTRRRNESRNASGLRGG